MSAVEYRKLSPVLFVDSVDRCLPFWEHLGFQKTVEVPGEGGLNFAILVAGPVEVMLQSHASVAEDVPALALWARSASGGLFLEISNFDEIEQLLSGADLVFPRRKTFYGSTEIAVWEPGGTVVTFAEFPPKA